MIQNTSYELLMTCSGYNIYSGGRNFQKSSCETKVPVINNMATYMDQLQHVFIVV